VKRKRNEEFIDAIVLEERPTKVSKKQFEDTLKRLQSMSLSTNTTVTTHNKGRKLFRYIGTTGESTESKILSPETISRRKEQVKSKQTALDREQRSQKHVNASKSARFNNVNKLRSLPPPLSSQVAPQGFAFLELIAPESEKPTEKKAKQTTVLLDDRPPPIISTSKKATSEPDEVTDYYYLDNEGFHSSDEVADATVVPVESFDVDDDSIFVHEYDGDDIDNEDSEGECDYPDTPNEDSLEEHWGGSKLHSSNESGEGNSSSDEISRLRHGYDPNESQEEYDDYI